MHASARASTSASRLGRAAVSKARPHPPFYAVPFAGNLAAQQKRSYAVPVNPGSSVDAMLGTSVPPPPREGAEIQTSKYYRPNNPNDLSDLLNPSKSNPFGAKNDRGSGGPKRDGGARYAEIQRIKGTAIGAERKGTPIPSRDEMLDEMFKRPFRELEESKDIVDREHPHPIDAMKGRNELDERVLAAARALHAAGTLSKTPSAATDKESAPASKLKAASISELLDLFEERAGAQLSIELPYESTPSDSRKVKLTSASSSEEELQHAQDDGVLLLAYITNLHGGRGKERISVCSGFAIDGGDRMADNEGDGKGHLVVSCAHTLRAAGLSAPKSKSGKAASASDDASIAFAITRTGAIYPIRTLISSLGASDIVLLQLGEEPLTLHEGARPSIRTLPISPYPATVNTELSVSSFWGWEDDSGAVLPAYSYDEQQQKLRASRSPPPPAGREPEQVKLERDDAGRSRWGRARLVEYKDPCGGQALVGTYDELAQLDYKLLISSPANPPALQGNTAMQMSSSVSASSQPTVVATSATSSGQAMPRRQPLPNFPPPGSSGGPVVDVESGSVVGVVRGHKMSPLEGRRGDAIPAEKIFEFFALPGLGKKN
ncbi:uncharacterized protein PFL1_06490 [Pseudozyma flocculosa PF-1]|uniref:Uncharacterized protein n=2 Tax=Pseudozyma flocculosa TaxID=84751 RepID=A0A5C3ETI3_9BASI|nr:uncharacterized protein PFL1_06490 [Pseudozyma flocculosa PF-1]EPQ26037.1 hypothetical protein PFL1_06490 [Pseudozyma flocculosa PF-1]SPO35654.1 uncharacterized protein PSFLO_01125 [Pseudozyma flocculosa]